MLIRLTVVIILQYMQTSNHYVVHLKHNVICLLYLSKKDDLLKMRDAAKAVLRGKLNNLKCIYKKGLKMKDSNINLKKQ